MRIAWLTESYPPGQGGMAQSCDRIVRGLRAAGVELDLFHLCARLRRWEEQRQRGGSYFACPVHADAGHTLNRLWSRLEPLAAGYTHLVAFGGNLPLLAAPVLAAWMDRPLVTLLRGNDFDVAVFHPARVQVLARALTASALVGCVSRDKVRKVRALFPTVEARWVPNGIDLDGWQLHAFDRRRGLEWREAFVPAGCLTIGVFGHLKAKKGLLFLLDVLRRSPEHRAFHCLLAGELGAEAAEWLEGHEQDIGFTPLPFLDRYDLLPLYAASDYVALPSFYDGMPNVLLEAMALGIPLIASRVGGMADLLEDGVHGYLFEPGDGHGLRRALARAAVATSAQRERLGGACRELVQTRLTAGQETAAYLALLRAAAPGD